jgi:phospholipase/carboxylesterase
MRLARRQRIVIYVVLILAGALFLLLRWQSSPAAYRHTLPGHPEQEYYLYVSRGYTPARLWPLLVFIHGSGGNAAGYFAAFQQYADLKGYILLCPTFTGDTFRLLAGGEDVLLLNMIAELRTKYRLADRFFLGGFSAGAQFAHRFAFRYPSLLCGVAAHSARSYDPPPPASFGAPPFAISVGEVDAERRETNRRFADELAQKGYDVTFTVIPNAGHQFTPGAFDQTLTLFDRACVGQ